ncbi:hypothetical protein ACFYZB_21370 [Streptomyces sp. NPDC001852]|uniref:hypothetical protein n=1 Tax=Streptomyces sp. NPDC001852 TaxID=3364619 RepID=UPI003678587B
MRAVTAALGDDAAESSRHHGYLERVCGIVTVRGHVSVGPRAELLTDLGTAKASRTGPDRSCAGQDPARVRSARAVSPVVP